MFRRLLLTIFLILAFFMRAVPHEAESGQSPLPQTPLIQVYPKNIPEKLIPNQNLKPELILAAHDQVLSKKKQKPSGLPTGKMIRRIEIKILDPFGYSLQDTTLTPRQFPKRVGNALHVSTHEKVIKNLLLIHEHQPFDSLLFKESERLIRAQKYVQDVVASISIASPDADSVDVHFRIIDIWSIIPTWRKTGQLYQAGLADNNFLGTGNRLQLDTRLGETVKDPVIQLGYIISNMGNTHITASFQYYFSGANDLINNPGIRKPSYSSVSYILPTMNLSNRYLMKSFEIQRSFFSPLTRWAGGIFAGRLATLQNYQENDSVRYLSSSTNIQDLWGAVSFPASKINLKAARTSGIILSARVLRIRYPQAIAVTDQTSLFNNVDFYLAGIGLSSRGFIQDRYVFNYGKIEDIPVGRSLGITTGIYRQKNTRFYLGLKAAWGNNYAFGYLGSVIEYGTYMGSDGWEQQVINAKANYYTRLFNAGYWRIRQFIKPSVIVGINRMETDNLSAGSIMKGIEELKIPATRLMALTLQTQSYAPQEIYGFRFGPYIFSSIGWLSHTDIQTRNHFYAALGLGVLIKNNYLLINTFQLSFTFYPSLPGKGHPALELNAYKTIDYGLSDFEISKPQVVEYR